MSYAPSALRSPAPPRPPGTDAPPTREVPYFAPVRVRGLRHRTHRLLRHRRRAVAAGLAVTAAALVAAGPQPGGAAHGDRRVRGHPVTAQATRHPAPRLVSAPVRIADAETVRLLRPGDRVDVVAAGTGAGGTDARAGGATSVVARGARVAEVPGTAAAAGEGGSLVVLSVPRATAARLVGAGTLARLAVILW